MQDCFWSLTYPSSERRRAEWDSGKVELEGIECPANAGHQRGGRRLTDLNVVLPNGPVEDFVWTWHSECLLRDRSLKLLRSSGLTGFEVKPVQARFRKSVEEPPKLWELVVTGWAGMARPESGVRLDEPNCCAVCGYLAYTGLTRPERLIDESEWDGSDFFMVWPMPRFVFVTERARRTIQEHNLTGVRLLPVSELGPSDGYTPGRLSYWMPEERARQLGEPLGIY